MPGWVNRWQKRRREAGEGADADIMQANHRRFRVAFALIGFAVLLALLGAKLLFPVPIDTVLRAAAGICGVVGFVMAKWAQQEHAFLTRPDSGSPPEIIPKYALTSAAFCPKTMVNERYGDVETTITRWLSRRLPLL
jgi:hypothetical protein